MPQGFPQVEAVAGGPAVPVHHFTALAAEGLLQEGHQPLHRHLQKAQDGAAGPGVDGDVAGVGLGEHGVGGQGQGFHPGGGFLDLGCIKNNQAAFGKLRLVEGQRFLV